MFVGLNVIECVFDVRGAETCDAKVLFATMVHVEHVDRETKGADFPISDFDNIGSAVGKVWGLDMCIFDTPQIRHLDIAKLLLIFLLYSVDDPRPNCQTAIVEMFLVEYHSYKIKIVW